MIIDEEKVDEMQDTANDLSDKIDEVITRYVDGLSDDEDDGAVPFVVLAALANVLTKLALVVGDGRQFIFDSLDEMIPSDDDLREMEDSHKHDNVIPINSRLLH